jgi:hypothetical protein
MTSIMAVRVRVSTVSVSYGLFNMRL